MKTYNRTSDAPLFSRLPLSVQTLYAELVQALVSAAAAGTLGGRRGSFVKKQVRGHTYWYFQYRDQGKQHQRYLGADSPELRAFMAEAKSSAANRARLCAMAAAGGAYAHRGSELAALQLLADAGVFQVGAVVVGSHAFATYGNMLGVSWRDAAVRTDDIDIADDPRLSLAMHTGDDRVDLPRTLQQWAGGRFLPVPPSPLTAKDPVTSFHDPRQGLQIELLTPLVGRARRAPVMLPSLNAAAQPLRFLDYLIEEPVPAAVVGARGVLIQVPQPARYALHKLLVAGRRQPWEGKAQKDIAQAEALCAVLLGDLPGALSVAWEALAPRGKRWVSGVRASLPHLGAPIRAGLKNLGIEP